jgi:hypothetical protein
MYVTKKMGTGPWWRCPNVQLYGVLGLRELIGDTTDANRVYSRSKPPPENKKAPDTTVGISWRCADVGRRPGADAVRRGIR